MRAGTVFISRRVSSTFSLPRAAGSRFRTLLRGAARCGTIPALASAAMAIAFGQPFMNSKRLLFIQDDPFLGSLYRDKLELAGFSVETARDADSGLELLEEIRPDLMVLDP